MKKLKLGSKAGHEKAHCLWLSVWDRNDKKEQTKKVYSRQEGEQRQRQDAGQEHWLRGTNQTPVDLK